MVGLGNAERITENGGADILSLSGVVNGYVVSSMRLIDGNISLE